MQEGQGLEFIDLFAGIGFLRLGFQQAAKEMGIPTKCVFTSEIDPYSRKTYCALFPGDAEEPAGDITLCKDRIPPHSVLLAGFPCQPFSIAGVSKKNALGRPHGFKCKEQGNLFFEIRDILKKHKPDAFLLENVKHLKRHDKGRTLEVILDKLEGELGYKVRLEVYDARGVVPQHRERVFLLGFKDHAKAAAVDFTPLEDKGRTLGDILQDDVDPKYVLTPRLWTYLKEYKAKHQKQGNGFGFGLVGPGDIARTLSARYYKDGSEILVDRGPRKRPRRLTPTECALLMGFEGNFPFVVSDMRAYKQFGNSVVIPVVRHVSKILLEALGFAPASLPLRDAG